MDPDEEESCPLCMIDFDGIDKLFTPCGRCRYRICRYCFFRIVVSPARTCPGCRGNFQIRRVILSLLRMDPQSAFASINRLNMRSNAVYLRVLSAIAYFKPDTGIPFKVLEHGGIHSPAHAVEEFRSQWLVQRDGKDSFCIREETQTELRRCFGELEAITLAGKLLEGEYIRMTCHRDLAVINKTVPHSKMLWSHIAANREYATLFCRFPSHVWATFFQQDQLEESLQWAIELDRTTSSVFQPIEQDYLNGKLRIGIALLRLCRFDEAYALLSQIFQVCLQSPIPGMNMTLTCGSFLGLTLTEMGYPEAGLELFDHTMPHFTFHPQHRFVLGVKLRKGIALSKLGRDYEALDHFQLCANCFTDLYTIESRATCNALRWMAFTFCRLGKLEKALELFEKVYETEKLILRSEHPAFSTTISGMVTVLLKMGDYKEAFKICFNQLNTVKDGKAIEEVFALLEMEETMAQVLLAQRRLGMAKALLAQIYEQRIEVHGHRNFLTRKAKIDFENVKTPH